MGKINYELEGYMEFVLCILEACLSTYDHNGFRHVGFNLSEILTQITGHRKEGDRERYLEASNEFMTFERSERLWYKTIEMAILVLGAHFRGESDLEYLRLDVRRKAIEDLMNTI